MPNYLSLNGVTVRVAVDSVSLRYVSAGGDEERSPSGSLEGGPMVLKREWAMATTPVPASELDAWVGLIEGKGHSWPYDADLYSARGRGPSYVGAAALISGSAVYGAKHLRTGTADDVLYDIALPSTWTVLFWRLESGTWRRYLVTSDGAKWRDGVRNDALSMTGIFAVTGTGQLRIGDTGGVTGIRDFDDVVALPYLVPEAWAEPMQAWQGDFPWSALPQVTAEGDFASGSVTVRGKVTDSRVIRANVGGSLTSAHSIQFTIREV